MGLYYLNTRFYDQNVGRFLNPDNPELVLASQTAVTDKNLYAYCDNNPVKGWISAVDLRAGDLLVLRSGEYVVIEQVQHEILESPVKVYNFEVEDYHTYYVSGSEVLVHNTCRVGKRISYTRKSTY